MHIFFLASKLSDKIIFATLPKRNFGSPAPTPVSAATQTVAVPKVPDDVVIPELVDSLEWVLDSPPNIHQFEEPPVIYFSITLNYLNILLN